MVVQLGVAQLLSSFSLWEMNMILDDMVVRKAINKAAGQGVHWVTTHSFPHV